MSKVRKLLSLALAVMLVFSLATTAFAAHDSITINSANKGETYTLYKMFNLEVDNVDNPTAYTYKVATGWEAFFGEGGAGASYITINDAGAVEGLEQSKVEGLAKAAAGWSGKPAATRSTEADSDTVVFSGLGNGYWLVTSSLGTVAMTRTTPGTEAVTITEKNKENTIEKQVKEDDGGQFGASNNAQIGQTVEFKSTVTLVKNTRNVVVHDTMTSGLTYTAGSVDIAGLTKGTDYTVDENPADGDTFDITFTDTYINSLTAPTTNLVITYSATLNENAIADNEGTLSIEGQTNTTNVSFGDASVSVNSTTTTTTHSFSVYKHAEGATDNLAGAVFELKKGDAVVSLIKLDDNNYRVAKTDEAGAVTSFTTVATGDIVIWGVDADSDYSLVEKSAPDGYNTLTEPFAVTVDAANGYRANITNKAGSTLPETGGVGTTLFYVFGSVLVLAAVVLLVTKKRMASGE